MIGLAWRLFRASGWGRAALMASCTAVVAGLFLVAVAVASLPAHPAEPLFDAVANPGNRGGYVFATVLLTVPPLLLLHQVVRLGTADRERRLAGLRLAGATPGQVRTIGAMLVGVPALAGGMGGIGVYWALRSLLGRDLRFQDDPGWEGPAQASLRLVPTTVTPSWWEVLLVVAVVTLLGIAVGLLAGRGVIVTPLGVTRRAAPPPPRPWGVVPLVLVPILGPFLLWYWDAAGVLGLIVAFALIALLVGGMLTLAPWVAFVTGRYVASRARTATVLLAARRLASEPRATGRAASAVGAVGLVAGGCAAFVSDLLSTGDSGGDTTHYVAIAVIGAALLSVLVPVIGSLAVHSIETVLDHKRSVAALSAIGTPSDLLVRVQRWEAGLVALPVSLGGCLFGAALLGAPFGADPAVWLLCTAVTLAALAGLVGFAILTASWLTRPWILRAANPANLRTA